MQRVDSVCPPGPLNKHETIQFDHLLPPLAAISSLAENLLVIESPLIIMNRRSYLATFAGGISAGFAGCTSRILPSRPAEPTVQRVVQIASIDRSEKPHEFRFDVEVVNPLVTDTETALVRTTVTNTGPKRRVGAAKPLFARGAGGSVYTFGLWLVTSSRMESITRESDRWIYDPSQSYGPSTELPPVLAAGESVSHDYFVWDNAQYEGYMPPDTYPFRPSYPIRTAGEDGPRRATWGFSLDVSNPDDPAKTT